MNKESLRLNGEEDNKGFISQIFIQAKKMQLNDWKSLGLLLLSFIPGKIWKFCNHHLWVISEYENLARDNGYWFFKYIRDNYPDKTVYYPINPKAADAKKIVILGNLVIFSSFKHYLLFWAAEKQFTSSKNAGFPSRICEDLVQWNFHRFQYIMLNHGITKGKSTVVDVKKTNFDIICTCSDLDKDIIIQDNGQPRNKVITSGFARHDNLDDSLLDKHLILIMPTWRSWINYKRGRNSQEKEKIVKEFLKSDYFIKYNELLNNKVLNDYLNEKDLYLIFYLHDYAQYYCDYFYVNSDRIIIAHSSEYDVQTLLKQAALLITDYSSVCYDFAYMYKPVLYYQFDREQFEYYQYKVGDRYTYEENGVGELFYQINNLIKAIMDYCDNDFRMLEKFKNRVDHYFTHHDKKNCERILNYVINKNINH